MELKESVRTYLVRLKCTSIKHTKEEEEDEKGEEEDEEDCDGDWDGDYYLSQV
ncbi:hypothetical protein DPMN_119580 [Dreissena polymorpha]|uniref:Uncharacterized protein n=1 Tax=Dreissena polymorpha TaxID=45954 RepID=A0A9D4GMN3_DREPO|nr:hypothetical protein DPMN_119580 [Dreissena polymorpha]